MKNKIVTFFSPTREQHDPFFRESEEAKNDRHYGAADRLTYYFATADDIVAYLASDGVVMPVREKTSITKSHFSAISGNGRGVYIIDHYTLRGVTSATVRAYYELYLAICSKDATKETAVYFTDLLETLANDSESKDTVRRTVAIGIMNRGIEVRHVTYVPETYFLGNKMYVHSSGTVFFKSSANDDWSGILDYMVLNADSKQITNSVDVTVLSESTEVYYCKIAGVVIPVRQNQVGSSVELFVLRVYVGGIKYTELKLPLAEAISLGYVDTDPVKIDEMSSVEHRLKEMEHSVKHKELDTRAKLADVKIESSKIGLSGLLAKNEHALASSELKLSGEALKLVGDVVGLKHQDSKNKYELDVLALKRASEHQKLGVSILNLFT